MQHHSFDHLIAAGTAGEAIAITQQQDLRLTSCQSFRHASWLRDQVLMTDVPLTRCREEVSAELSPHVLHVAAG